jgi:hypothetical protein
MRFDEARERVDVEQRHIPAHDDDVSIEVVRESAECELDRSTRARDLVLVDDDSIRKELDDGRDDRVALVPNDRDDVRGP